MRHLPVPQPGKTIRSRKKTPLRASSERDLRLWKGCCDSAKCVQDEVFFGPSAHGRAREDGSVPEPKTLELHLRRGDPKQQRKAASATWSLNCENAQTTTSETSCWSVKLFQCRSLSEHAAVPRYEINIVKVSVARLGCRIHAQSVDTKQFQKRSAETRPSTLHKNNRCMFCCIKGFNQHRAPAPLSEKLHLDLSPTMHVQKPSFRASRREIVDNCCGLQSPSRPALNRTCHARMSTERLFLPFLSALLPQKPRRRASSCDWHTARRSCG